MSTRPPGGSLNRKNCPNEPTSLPNPVNFCHLQFPQHMQLSQPPYAMNIPFHQFPQQHLYPPNVQYVVVQPQYAPYSLPPRMPPQLPALVMPSTSASDSGTPRMETRQEEQDIDIVHDETAEPVRTSKRLHWTEQEDVRLIRIWLNSPKNKKYDMYWVNVIAAYNSNTPKDRRREPAHLRCHWHKMIPKIARFDDCWCQVKAKYPSDLSDNMQLMDKTWVMFNVEAQAMYLEEVKRRFAYNHCWKVVWDQPKWKSYILSLTSRKAKLSESGDYTSSSEDTEDDPDKEISEEGSVTAKEKYEGKGEVEKDIQCSQDLQNMLKTNPGEMIGVQLLHADQNLEPSRIETLERKDDEALISEKQPELLMTAASWYNEFLPGSELSAGNSKFSELQHGGVLREDEPEKGTLKQGYKALDHDRATAMENLPEKDNTQVVKKPDHGRAVRENVPESKTGAQSCKVTKLKRKRQGKALPCSSEVQEDIKLAVDLQTMLMKDREKMSEVQLRLSKEKLEFAKLKQQEAKDKKETTLYEKYSELLMADTSRFSDFQKAEYEKAVKRMGEMLFGRDDR
ncbi:uncharacterized protein LOC123452634 [Hordeum vulgare subsp. vulgare]|uniref:uncharacterized protein LOC123452634 n=1 Tax=Hordeum vulgare subsp. vulgare TaxID=112509 RepID=UPI000296CC30|nr:uncharacterized protein LOC123452634 [Hordeum vulgare subsp. vulgare]XP_044985267.1 uncharacterized protein LOC123452634 [Hordeum vulgare subsp. vulgare]